MMPPFRPHARIEHDGVRGSYRYRTSVEKILERGRAIDLRGRLTLTVTGTVARAMSGPDIDSVAGPAAAMGNHMIGFKVVSARAAAKPARRIALLDQRPPMFQILAGSFPM